MNQRLKEMRKALHITQKELADALNISKSAVEAYEYRRAELTDRTIADICRVYGVNETWLRTGEGEMFAPKEREHEIAELVNKMLTTDNDDFRLELTRLLYSLDEQGLDTLKSIAVKLAAAVKEKAPE